MSQLQRPLSLAFVLTAAVLLSACSKASGVVATPTASTTATASAESTASPAPSTSAPTSPSTSVSASPATPAGRRIEITVTGKQVKPEPATINIAVGESLTVAVTSDQDNTLHAHGFEIEKNLKAGKRAEVTIKGAEPGVFDFELHHPELRLFQVAVR